MPEPESPQPSNLAFKVITVIAAGLILYIGVCGARLSLLSYGDHGITMPNGLIFITTGGFMVVVISVWLILRAVLRKDKP